jgi:hypothetical protein
MELDSSQSARASKPSSLGSIQDLVAFFFRYLEPPAATLGVGVSRGWLSVADSCSPIRKRPYLFWRLCYYVGRLPALPDDADLALSVGLERPGTCSGASAGQYWNGGDLQI